MFKHCQKKKFKETLVKRKLSLMIPLFFNFRKNKAAQQYASEVRFIWMAVDPITRIYPNALMNDELIEQRFYIPQRDLLIANKDKEPYEQEPHIQAPTIKSKLISFTRFLSFLVEQKIYIGLTHEHITHFQQMANNCKRNMSNLCQDRLQRLKEFKSSILINTQTLNNYGSSGYIIKLAKFLKDLENDSKMCVSLPMAIDVRDYLMLCV